MEVLKHECGVAMVRLLKPLEYYHEKYGSWMYGLNKLYLLMEKQHNRGQEGAGLACVKLEANAGEEYMFRERAVGTGAITEIFAAVHEHYKDLTPDYHPSTKVSAKITGFFRFEEECPEEERERMITLQGLTTLYSLLRGYVGSLTASSPLGLTMLPMIMMKDVIEQAREKQKELSSQKSS